MRAHYVPPSNRGKPYFPSFSGFANTLSIEFGKVRELSPFSTCCQVPKFYRCTRRLVDFISMVRLDYLYIEIIVQSTRQLLGQREQHIDTD